MYSILIVDDEKMIRDEVYDLLNMEEDLELDLLQADSALEALEIMMRQKIDIIITDINMPVMSGLELYDKIREYWSYSKIIFLTGYSEFDYVYKVHKHARYLLKAEEDEKIVEAVRESIAEIENDLLVQGPKEDDAAGRSLQHERSFFLQNAVEDVHGIAQLTPEVAEWLKIPFLPDDPAYYVILRHENMYEADYRQMRRQIDNLYELVERCFLFQVKGTFFEPDRNHIVVLIRPRKMADEATMCRCISGNAEMFLKAANKNMNKTFSVLIGSRPLTLREIFRSLTDLCNEAIWLQKDEIHLSWEKSQTKDLAGTEVREPDKQRIRQLVWKLEDALEDMDEDLVLKMLDCLKTELQSVRSMHDLFAMEIYCQISSRMLSLIKRLRVNEEIAFRIGIMGLYNVSSHRNWQDAFGYLQQVGKELFGIKNQNTRHQNEETVASVKKYIHENLAGDTSLYVLSEQVHFSQEHLLRVFKKSEGITILQYINDLKLQKAKDLLVDTNLQMREIAELLGFNSAGYFGRFFRNKTGKTPQNYRESETTGK